MRRHRKAGDKVLKGAVAGAIATWALDLVTNWMYQREPAHAREQEDRLRHGRTAYEAAAERAAELLGKRLTDHQRQRLGTVIHWALGIGAGVAYSTFARNLPAFRRAGGAAFGTAFWAGVDEALVSLLGLTPPPQTFPWETHARGLTGHLAYGIVADRTLRVLDSVA
jgi:hypothetical protein